MTFGGAATFLERQAADWQRFLFEVEVLGGDPDQAARLVCQHMVSNGGFGISVDMLLARLRQGMPMVGDVTHPAHRPGGRPHRHLPNGGVIPA